jgi:hypothetical protein
MSGDLQMLFSSVTHLDEGLSLASLYYINNDNDDDDDNNNNNNNNP